MDERYRDKYEDGRADSLCDGELPAEKRPYDEGQTDDEVCRCYQERNRRDYHRLVDARPAFLNDAVGGYVRPRTDENHVALFEFIDTNLLGSVLGDAFRGFGHQVCEFVESTRRATYATHLYPVSEKEDYDESYEFPEERFAYTENDRRGAVYEGDRDGERD
ncbi:MAG: hypothetical protein ACI9QA_000277 [Methanobacteriota archaeon]|jgi:hypothetical protein